MSLVAQLKRGDAQAFEQAFALYQPGVYRFLRRLTRNDAVALELSQETWLRLAEDAPWLRDDTVLRAWLFTVARNLFLSHRRWSLLDGSRLDELFRWGKGAVDERTPEATAAGSQAQRRLEAALERLPLKHREALALVAGEGFAPGEAAAVLGITPEAFRQRLSRARDQLKGMLTEIS